MSKTDDHKPMRAAENLREYHDHTKGYCNLPTLEEWRKNYKGYRGYKACTWEPANWHTYKGFGRSKGERFWRKEEQDRKDSKRGKDDYDY